MPKPTIVRTETPGTDAAPAADPVQLSVDLFYQAQALVQVIRNEVSVIGAPNDEPNLLSLCQAAELVLDTLQDQLEATEQLVHHLRQQQQGEPA